MITRTTENAIQILLLMAKEPIERIISMSEITAKVEGSPTYLAKVVLHLSKAGVLKSFRGTQGGVQLAKPLNEITLLHVVEACQGQIHAAYCSTQPSPQIQVCGFHAAMLDIRNTLMEALSRWTIADLLATPHGIDAGEPLKTCQMRFLSQFVNP